MGIYTPEEQADFSTSSAPSTVEIRTENTHIPKLEALFESREAEVNAYLLTTGKIKEGQNFRDLSVSDASKVISKPDLILSKLPAQTVTAEVVNE